MAIPRVDIESVVACGPPAGTLMACKGRLALFPTKRNVRCALTTPEQFENQDALEALVRGAAIEIIPLQSAIDKLTSIPSGSTVTVTCSAKLGLARTLEFTAVAAEAGYRVVPHLAARQVTDRQALRSFIGRLDDLGVNDLYVIGGDVAAAAGPYAHAADLLEALQHFDHGLTSIGVACYPEGHPAIDETQLSTALQRAQPLAHYMVSQMCFDHNAILRWLTRTRAEGVSLPMHLGLAAPLQIRRLVELSLKIGVGSSIRFLTKQHGFVGKMMRGSSYRPQELLQNLIDETSLPEVGIDGLHLFTFNQVDETVRWQASIAGRAIE